MALASLTRRMAQVTLRPTISSTVSSKAPLLSTWNGPNSPNSPLLFTTPFHQQQQIRFKGISKNKKVKKQKAAAAKAAAEALEDPNEQSKDTTKGGPSALHEEWVKLQQSIAVDGFDTGQMTKASSSVGQKKRGGKAVRRREAKELELTKTTADRERMLSELGGGEYPPERYSDEETERLLALAYANIPERAGKRGTRNLKRQHLRWHYVRRARKKLKREKIQAHFRRMAKRSRIAKEVMAIKATSADVVEKEQAYQQQVLERYLAQTMQVHKNDGIEDEGDYEDGGGDKLAASGETQK